MRVFWNQFIHFESFSNYDIIFLHLTTLLLYKLRQKKCLYVLYFEINNLSIKLNYWNNNKCFYAQQLSLLPKRKSLSYIHSLMIVIHIRDKSINHWTNFVWCCTKISIMKVNLPSKTIQLHFLTKLTGAPRNTFYISSNTGTEWNHKCLFTGN